MFPFLEKLDFISWAMMSLGSENVGGADSSITESSIKRQT
jgi:hypothetical protein